VRRIYLNKSAFVNAFTVGTLKFMLLYVEQIRRVYFGWQPNTQRNSCNGRGHFSDFLLKGIVEQIYDLESKDELN
jgi:hypothetical protein